MAVEMDKVDLEGPHGKRKQFKLIRFVDKNFVD